MNFTDILYFTFILLCIVVKIYELHIMHCTLNLSCMNYYIHKIAHFFFKSQQEAKTYRENCGARSSAQSFLLSLCTKRLGTACPSEKQKYEICLQTQCCGFTRKQKHWKWQVQNAPPQETRGNWLFWKDAQKKRSKSFHSDQERGKKKKTMDTNNLINYI